MIATEYSHAVKLNCRNAITKKALKTVIECMSKIESPLLFVECAIQRDRIKTAGDQFGQAMDAFTAAGDILAEESIGLVSYYELTVMAECPGFGITVTYDHIF